jgi:hypothetical protein
MHPKTFHESIGVADQPSVHERPARLDRSPQEATFQLTRRAALIVVLTVSLGLWAAIWAAVASLASAALG